MLTLGGGLQLAIEHTCKSRAEHGGERLCRLDRAASFSTFRGSTKHDSSSSKFRHSPGQSGISLSCHTVSSSPPRVLQMYASSSVAARSGLGRCSPLRIDRREGSEYRSAWYSCFPFYGLFELRFTTLWRGTAHGVQPRSRRAEIFARFIASHTV